MNPPLRITVGPPDFIVQLPSGGHLQLYNYSDAVGVSLFKTNGDIEVWDLTHEQYERFRQKVKAEQQLDLPEIRKPAVSTSENGNTVGRVVGESGAAAVPAPAANPPVQPQTPAEAGTGSKILDGLQVGLDVVGLVPAVGELADLGNAAISALRGDWVGAGLSLAAAIPFAGWGATGAKAVRGRGSRKGGQRGRRTGREGSCGTSGETRRRWRQSQRQRPRLPAAQIQRGMPRWKDTSPRRS
jgi:hypothetical protein